MAKQYITKERLSYYHGLIKNLFAAKEDVPSKTSELENDSNFAVDASYVHTDNNYTTSEKTKLAGIDESADVNVIESVKVNGAALGISEKSVNVTVAEGKENGTVSVNGSDVAVHGLGSAAYADADALGDDNVIESVKVNGSALTPDADKAVDVTVPTTVAQLTDASEYANVITGVSVNNTALTPANKSVNIQVPTTVAELTDASDYALASAIPTNNSALTNGAGYQTASDVSTYVTGLGYQTAQQVQGKIEDYGYQTASDVSSAIDTALSSVYTVKGSVDTYADLPSSGRKTGDVYNVVAANGDTPAGTNYVFNGSAWDALGGTIDLSGYVLASDVQEVTNAEIDAIVNAA